MSESILQVSNLKKYFKTGRGMLHAVDDISFTLEKGKTLGIVGESGCGKSTTGRCILRLIEPTSGKVVFDGEDILQLSGRKQRERRSDMQIIFQDPFSSLNPRKTVMQTIAEGVEMRGKYRSKAQIENRVLELMETVGLAERLINSYSPRTGRRPPAAYRHRPSAGRGTEADHLRRAGFRPGRIDPGADPKPAEGAPAETQPDIHLHHTRPGSCQSYFG